MLLPESATTCPGSANKKHIAAAINTVIQLLWRSCMGGGIRWGMIYLLVGAALFHEEITVSKDGNGTCQDRCFLDGEGGY